MRDLLLLRLEAPLMSFGAPLVDQHGFTQDFPGRAMLAGLIGNALGYLHRDWDRLALLQDGLSYAARQDRVGERLVDFQTVYLGHPHMSQGGWTTWGRKEERGGGSPRETHIRYRHYLADAVYTVALETTGEAPGLDELEQALRAPARPLFIGRKCCLPSVPVFLGRTRAAGLVAALEATPLPRRAGQGSRPCWWPDRPEEPQGDDSMVVAVIDDRDWENRIHTGKRFLRKGLRPMRAQETHHAG